ncbi:Crp/Fnr family transcriptional regulator [Candidatus Acetothermia bacterium]|nr:Crp/Fnr family transcriptional regulator [Candidatus Acetothermia bacterium]
MRIISDQSRLGPQMWQALLNISQPQEFSPGAILQHELTPAASLLLIEAGCVTLRMREPSSQRLLLIDILGVGDVLNADTIWTNDLSTWRAEALTAVHGHLTAREPLQHLLKERPELAEQLLAWLAGSLHAWRDWLTRSVYGDSETRVLHVIRWLAERYGHPEGRGLRLQLPLRRKDLAELAGVAPETVVRLLGQFHRQELIHPQSNNIFIPDPARLNRP